MIRPEDIDQALDAWRTFESVETPLATPVDEEMIRSRFDAAELDVGVLAPCSSFVAEFCEARGLSGEAVTLAEGMFAMGVMIGSEARKHAEKREAGEPDETAD